jgi:(1->4)-alpha-D-glucan 1-alpha-D-glucosylmutase
MQLQEEYVAACLERETGAPLENRVLVSDRLAAVQKHERQPEWPLYVVIEKILSETEPLPYTWAVYGTTGYDFLSVVNNLFVDTANEAAFDALYEDFLGQPMDFASLVDYTKKLTMNEALTSEIDSCSAQLARIIEGNRHYRGFTQNSLTFGLSEIIAALPIYRTYITGPGDVSGRDRHYIEQAVRTAKRRNPLTPVSLFDFLRATLLMENLTDFTEEQRADLRSFVMKFQQITGPVMAKSVEDTAFYVYNRLVSLNEVGGHPEQFGLPLARFHQHNADVAFPYTMLTTATHDTKRGEDTRARINVLSEMPAAWAEAIEQWAGINAPAKTLLDDTPAPSANDEYLLYQTLIGIFPDQPPTAADIEDVRGRATEYMYKAINEAKTHSNWVNPNDAYARATADFIARILDDAQFRQSFDPFQQRVAFFGRINGLAQALLKLTSPGVPDIYQGCELWSYTLVDPDNRRPVDFAARRSLLAFLAERTAEDALQLTRDLVEEAHTGTIKFYTTWRTLTFGRDHASLFREGTYIPLESAGAQADHVCAYVRQTDTAAALVLVPRLVVGLTQSRTVQPLGADVWGDTWLRLPPELRLSRLENVLTGEKINVTRRDGQAAVSVAEALSVVPVGLFEALP